uniref:hypothetical protein n=1 Tax=Streptomyces broussonetiae TaxID=2686304 RepID=UPI0035E309C1
MVVAAPGSVSGWTERAAATTGAGSGERSRMSSIGVSYAPGAAGTLYACAAPGMFAGDLAVGRLVPPVLRPRLATPLRLLLAVPYLFFFLRPGWRCRRWPSPSPRSVSRRAWSSRSG